MVPEFAYPGAARAAGAETLAPPFPPLIVPLLVSVAIAPELSIPAPPAPLVKPAPPLIVPPVAFMSGVDRRSACVRTRPRRSPKPEPPLIVPLAVT